MRGKFYLSWFVLALFYAYQHLLRIYPGSFLNEMCSTFHISADGFATLGACCMLAYSISQFFFGFLLDKIGVRRLILIASVLCLIGHGIFLCTQSVILAQFGRVLIGLGGAPAFMAVIKLASDCFNKKLCGIFIGFAVTLSMLLGIVGNIFLKKTSLSKNDWKIAAYDLNGFGIFIFILCLLFLQTKKEKGKTEKQVVAFKPLMNILTNYRCYLYAFLAIGTSSVVVTLADLWGPSFLMAKYQLQPLQAVKYNQLIYTGMLIGSSALPFFFRGTQKIILGIGVSSFVITILLGVLIYIFEVFPVFILQNILFMLGVFCSADVLCFALIAQLATHQTSGFMLGFVNTMITLGTVGLEKGAGFILDKSWGGTLNSDHIRLYSIENYQIALSPLLITSVLCLILSFTLILAENGTKSLSYER